MPRSTPAPLTRREREIVDALFALDNRASAEAIRLSLTNPPSYSAVRALLVRIEQKSHVRHVEEGGRYIYSATTSPTDARRQDELEAGDLRVVDGGSRRPVHARHGITAASPAQRSCRSDVGCNGQRRGVDEWCAGGGAPRQ